MYEVRIASLPDARTSFIPSMAITLLDGEFLQFVRMQQASGDFGKMVAAVEEFRLIRKSAGGKGTLRQMRKNDDEPEDPDHSDGDDDEQWAVEVAANLNTTPGKTFLAAVGKKRRRQRSTGPVQAGRQTRCARTGATPSGTTAAAATTTTSPRSVGRCHWPAR